MPVQTPADVLRSARVRLAAEAAWLHDPESDLAVDAAGHDCLPYVVEAVRWDVYGALLAAQSGDAALDAALWFFVEAAALGVRTEGLLSVYVMALVFAWNDAPERVHVDVLLVLDAALVLATAAEAA